MSKLYTLHKNNRLKKRKQIEELFAKGSSFNLFPLRVYYHIMQDGNCETEPIKAGFGVSKRFFKKAVDRNRVKRLLREAYRLQCIPLRQQLEQHNKNMIAFFTFTTKELPNYGQIKEKMEIILSRLIKNCVPQQQ